MAKFCTNCGNELDDRAVLCPKCGISQNQQVETNNNSSKNSMSVAGFILSFIFPLLGLIFSIIGLNKSKQTNTGRGLSIAGIIISSVIMVISTIIISVSIVSVNDAIQKAQEQANSYNDYDYNDYYYNDYDYNNYE